MIDKRDYGLCFEDRRYVIRKKFGQEMTEEIEELLGAVQNQIDPILGAILFVAREGDIQSLKEYIEMANEDEMGLRTIASVKHERMTGQLEI